MSLELPLKSFKCQSVRLHAEQKILQDLYEGLHFFYSLQCVTTFTTCLLRATAVSLYFDLLIS